MSKRKRTTLPRVTVLAFSKRDLAAFAQAVESLGLHVRDLQAAAQAIKEASARSAAARKANATRKATLDTPPAEGVEVKK